MMCIKNSYPFSHPKIPVSSGDQKETTLTKKVKAFAKDFIGNFEPLYVVLAGAIVGGALGCCGGPIGVAIGIILGMGLACVALGCLTLDEEIPVDTTSTREALIARMKEEESEYRTPS
jgi:hypothetical protein